MFGYSEHLVYGRELQNGDWVLIEERKCKVVEKFQRSNRLIAQSKDDQIKKQISDFQPYIKLIRKWWWFF